MAPGREAHAHVPQQALSMHAVTEACARPANKALPGCRQMHGSNTSGRGTAEMLGNGWTCHAAGSQPKGKTKGRMPSRLHRSPALQ